MCVCVCIRTYLCVLGERRYRKEKNGTHYSGGDFREALIYVLSCSTRDNFSSAILFSADYVSRIFTSLTVRGIILPSDTLCTDTSHKTIPEPVLCVSAYDGKTCARLPVAYIIITVIVIAGRQHVRVSFAYEHAKCTCIMWVTRAVTTIPRSHASPSRTTAVVTVTVAEVPKRPQTQGRL